MNIFDHINILTIKKLAKERPTLRFGCGEWMLPFLDGIKNIDIYETGKIYDYGSFKISPITLYHDCKTFGYRIFKGSHKLIHCTDTAHLLGITACNYDEYYLESNYNSDTIWDTINALESQGKYAYMRGSINTHLSEQQCNEFFYTNKKDNSKLIRLHQSNTI